MTGKLTPGRSVRAEFSIFEHTTYANSMALTAATVFVGGALAAWFGRERRGTIFGGEPVAAD